MGLDKDQLTQLADELAAEKTPRVVVPEISNAGVEEGTKLAVTSVDVPAQNVKVRLPDGSEFELEAKQLDMAPRRGRTTAADDTADSGPRRRGQGIHRGPKSQGSAITFVSDGEGQWSVQITHGKRISAKGESIELAVLAQIVGLLPAGDAQKALRAVIADEREAAQQRIADAQALLAKAKADAEALTLEG